MEVSLRELARCLGVTDKAVRKSIATGRLKTSIGRRSNGQPFCRDVELAAKEWVDGTSRVRTSGPQYQRRSARGPQRSAAGPQVDNQPALSPLENFNVDAFSALEYDDAGVSLAWWKHASDDEPSVVFAMAPATAKEIARQLLEAAETES